jgi:predicted Rossmann fold nucleotide-binding protein DprA/Smf involved in DNA uptake
MSNVSIIEQAVKSSAQPLSAKDVIASTGLKHAQVLMTLSYLAKTGKLKREKSDGVYKYAAQS